MSVPAEELYPITTSSGTALSYCSAVFFLRSDRGAKADARATSVPNGA